MLGIVVILTSVILTDNVYSTVNFYGATEAEHTLSTAIVGLTFDRIVAVDYTTSFFFEFRAEVWNSYPARQRIVTETECGLQLAVNFTPAEIKLASPEVVPADGNCKTLPTEVVYQTGLNKENLLLGIKFNYVREADLPNGIYDLTYWYGVNPEFSNKLSKAYTTRMEVVNGEVASVTVPDLPSEWGETTKSNLQLPIEFLLPLIIFPIFRKRQKD